ncbi:MAG: hypothetical protein JWP89_266 [Schlesneria sp.]|nr:hypothetical protein [Schlesneria sp.]
MSDLREPILRAWAAVLIGLWKQNGGKTPAQRKPKSKSKKRAARGASDIGPATVASPLTMTVERNRNMLTFLARLRNKKIETQARLHDGWKELVLAAADGKRTDSAKAFRSWRLRLSWCSFARTDCARALGVFEVGTPIVVRTSRSLHESYDTFSK